MRDKDKTKEQLINELKQLREQKQTAVEKIRQTLKEKELLLQEVYHRTKNNMEMVCSLLVIQTAHTNDEYIKIFRDIENRIRCMALVHEHLYNSKDFSNMNLKEYITNLVNLLMKSYQIYSDRISVLLELDNVFVSIDKAIVCGLILNELVSNSLKYAFPYEMSGKIRISLKDKGKGELLLQISDNGIGFPENFEIRKSDTLGLKLIFNIVECQLNGKIKFDLENGVSCQIRFRK